MAMKHKKRVSKLDTASTFSLSDFFYVSVLSGAKYISQKVTGTVMKAVLGITLLEKYWSDRNEPNGFVDPDNDVQISFVNETRTLTIEPQSTDYVWYSNATRYSTNAADNIIIPDTEGVHYIYYDGDTLSQTTTFSDDLILKFAFIAIIYWDATNNEQIYIGSEFKHGAKMSGGTHKYAHDVIQFALETGGGLGDILVDENGSSDTHAEFSVEATECHDEDAVFIHSAKGSTANIAVYYKTGATGSEVWRVDDTASFGVLTTGTGRAAYNQLTGGSWQLTEIANTKFLLAHVFVFNDAIRKFGVIIGENEYDTIVEARAGAETEINTVLLNGFISPEIKFLGSIIYQTADSYTNTVQSRIRSTDGGFDYIDLRNTGFLRGGGGVLVSDHSSLFNLDWENTGHSGTASNLAGFNSSGLADDVAIGTGLALTASSLAVNKETTLTDDDAKIPSSGAVFDALSAKTQNTQTDNYTLVIGDRIKHIIMNKGTAVTLTIPANASVAFAVGTIIPILNIGAGELTVAITSDTLSEADSQTKLAQGRAAYIYKHSSTVWWLVGETNA